ncbi:MAG: response regulator [Novosphingobium sp.]
MLVAEDEILIGILLEDMLGELGCTIVGPFSSIDEARVGAEAGGFDVALVDFNLNGVRATPLAELLARQGRPFAIVSGGGPEAEGHGETATLSKPFQMAELASVLHSLAARISGP